MIVISNVLIVVGHFREVPHLTLGHFEPVVVHVDLLIGQYVFARYVHDINSESYIAF